MGNAPRAASRGFSALELVAVLGVTALMGALAVSAYRTYVVRSQIAVAVAGAAGVQAHVTRAFRRDGAPPADRTAAGIAADGIAEIADVLESVDVVDGRIDLKFGARANEAIAGGVLSLTPFETADLTVVWICGNRAPGVGLKPLGFAAGARHATPLMTTIDSRYLPAACR